MDAVGVQQAGQVGAGLGDRMPALEPDPRVNVPYMRSTGTGSDPNCGSCLNPIVNFE